LSALGAEKIVAIGHVVGRVCPFPFSPCSPIYLFSVSQKHELFIGHVVIPTGRHFQVNNNYSNNNPFNLIELTLMRSAVEGFHLDKSWRAPCEVEKCWKLLDISSLLLVAGNE
jgi:hypothetical protein